MTEHLIHTHLASDTKGMCLKEGTSRGVWIKNKFVSDCVRLKVSLGHDEGKHGHV